MMVVSIRTRGILAGAASIMLTVAIVALTAYLNDWMKNHTRSILYTFVGAIGSAAILFLCWFFAEDKNTKVIQETSGDALSQSISSVTPTTSSGNIHFAPVIQIGATGSTPSQEPLPNPAEQNEKLPNLELKFAYGSAELKDAYFQFSPSGQKTLTIRVFNKPGAKFDEPMVARKITASVRLMYRSVEASVENTYWVDRDSNQIDLSPGANAHALIAVPSKFLLTMFENRNPISLTEREWNAQVYEPERVEFPLPSQAEVVGEIHIISRSSHISHRVLAHQRFSIEIDNGLSSVSPFKVKFI